MKVLVLNGPNLNLLGSREPEIYGDDTLADLNRMVTDWGTALGLEVETLQSNHEGVLIDAIQRDDVDGIVINPAAYSHTSRAIADAIAAVATPVVEVHISNIREREPWRAESVMSEVCVRTIYGRGPTGYRDALRTLVNRAALPFKVVSYGAHEEKVGDLRRGNRGLIVLIHGGFWRHEWERDTMESLAVDLSSRGWSTWNLEYRRIGAGGVWPESGEDVLAALDFVSHLGLEVDSCVIIGHSAGGYLALWAASRSPTPIKQLIGLGAITDLVMLADSGEAGSEEARTLLEAGAPPIPDPGGLPTLLVHGESDRHVPVTHSESLAARHDLALARVPGGHFELLDPAKAAWSSVVDALAGAG